jgi:hypothetical protein
LSTYQRVINSSLHNRFIYASLGAHTLMDGRSKSERNSMSLAMRFYWAIALAALLAAYVPGHPF